MTQDPAEIKPVITTKEEVLAHARNLTEVAEAIQSIVPGEGVMGTGAGRDMASQFPGATAASAK